MSAAAHHVDAGHETPIELVELTRAIEALPPAQRLTLQPALQRVLESTARRRKIPATRPRSSRSTPPRYEISRFRPRSNPPRTRFLSRNGSQIDG